MSEDERTAESAPEADTQTDTNTDANTNAQTDTIAGTTADATVRPGTTDNGATSAASAAERIAELERLLAAERDAATDYMQRWQRAAADFANFKRRAQQDLEQRQQLFAAQAMAPVLNALDSFERAFTQLPESLRGYTWLEGVALVEYQLRRALDAQGITEVPAEPGQPFDPTHHQAVGEVETDQHPAGHIATVLQRGYQMASLLVRPALVQVARVPETATPTDGATATASTPPEAQEEPPTPGPGP